MIFVKKDNSKKRKHLETKQKFKQITFVHGISSEVNGRHIKKKQDTVKIHGHLVVSRYLYNSSTHRASDEGVMRTILFHSCTPYISHHFGSLRN